MGKSEVQQVAKSQGLLSPVPKSSYKTQHTPVASKDTLTFSDLAPKRAVAWMNTLTECHILIPRWLHGALSLPQQPA